MDSYASIVMVTWRKGLHQRAEIARKSIASVLKNTEYPFEFILIDNTQNNRDLARARNMGLKMATGRHIVIMDDDIEVFPGWLTTCIHMIEAAKGKYLATPVHQIRVRKWEMPKVNGHRCNWHTGSNCMVAPREMFKEVGDFNERFSVNRTGVEYIKRQSRAGYSVLITDAPLALDLGAKIHSYV